MIISKSKILTTKTINDEFDSPLAQIYVFPGCLLTFEDGQYKLEWVEDILAENWVESILNKEEFEELAIRYTELSSRCVRITSWYALTFFESLKGDQALMSINEAITAYFDRSESEPNVYFDPEYMASYEEIVGFMEYTVPSNARLFMITDESLAYGGL